MTIVKNGIMVTASMLQRRRQSILRSFSAKNAGKRTATFLLYTKAKRTGRKIKAESLQYILACFHHVWASFEGSAEVYNEVHRTSETVNIIKKFVEENPKGKEDDNGKEEAGRANGN